MCSVQDDCDCKSEPIVPKAKLSPGRRCDKCTTEPAIIALRENDISCKACFVTQFSHKFRVALAKCKVIKHGDKVLVAISGGSNSSAMIKLIRVAMDEATYKRIKFEPEVLYIYDASGFGETPEEQYTRTQWIIKQVHQYGMTVHLTSMESAFESDIPTDSLTSLKPVENTFVKPSRGNTRFTQLLSSLKTLTSREDMLVKLRYDLMVKVAKALGFAKLIVGDSGQRMAIQLLTQISQGQGSQLSYTSGVTDTRWGEFVVIRPMSEFTSKEVLLYNRIHGVESIHPEELTTKRDTGASVSRLTENFVCGLQNEFPSTVSTVFRTARKLGLGASASDKPCTLCNAPCDVQPEECSAQKAFEVSRSLSEAAQSSNAECCDKSSVVDNLATKLCYSCTILLRDMNDPISCLPQFASREDARSRMKQEIGDYLLFED